MSDLSRVLTKDFLEKEYVEKKRFAKDIAMEVGCSLVTITNYLRKYGFKVEQRYKERPNYGYLNPARKIMTKEYLTKEYAESKRSMTNIARELGCSSSLVSEMLKRYGIQIEYRPSANANCGELNGEYSYGVYVENEYIVIYSPSHHLAGAKGYVRLHDMLAEFYFDHILQEDEIVHHKNENKQDNRKDNLVIMKKKEHDRYHTQKRWDEGTFIR